MSGGGSAPAQYSSVGLSSSAGSILQQRLRNMPDPSHNPPGSQHNMPDSMLQGPSQHHYSPSGLPGLPGGPQAPYYPQYPMDGNPFHFGGPDAQQQQMQQQMMQQQHHRGNMMGSLAASELPSILKSESGGKHHGGSSSHRKSAAATLMATEKHEQQPKSPLPLLTMELSPLTKPPKAPERPLIPYLRFSKSVWEKVKRENPHLQFVEIGKIIGQQWRNCPDEIRNKFRAEFLRDKEAYAQAQKAYLESPEYLAWHANKMKHEQMQEEVEKIKRGDVTAKESVQRPGPSSYSGGQMQPLHGPLEELQSMSQRIIPTKGPQPSSSQIQAPGDVDEDSDDYVKAKHVASTRYRRNHKLMAEVFSDAIVPDGRMVVSEQRMALLRKQVQSLSHHQERLIGEQRELIEKHLSKKQKLTEDTAAFALKWAKVKEDCTGVSKEQYQGMVDKYYKMYEKHVADYNAQNVRRQQMQPPAPIQSPPTMMTVSSPSPAANFNSPPAQLAESSQKSPESAFSTNVTHSPEELVQMSSSPPHQNDSSMHQEQAPLRYPERHISHPENDVAMPDAPAIPTDHQEPTSESPAVSPKHPAAILDDPSIPMQVLEQKSPSRSQCISPPQVAKSVSPDVQTHSPDDKLGSLNPSNVLDRPEVPSPPRSSNNTETPVEVDDRLETQGSPRDTSELLETINETTPCINSPEEKVVSQSPANRSSEARKRVLEDDDVTSPISEAEDSENESKHDEDHVAGTSVNNLIAESGINTDAPGTEVVEKKDSVAATSAEVGGGQGYADYML